MPPSRLIRIESVEYDWVAARYAGVAVCRAADGGLVRRRLAAPGRPGWRYARALAALRREALAA